MRLTFVFAFLLLALAPACTVLSEAEVQAMRQAETANEQQEFPQDGGPTSCASCPGQKLVTCEGTCYYGCGTFGLSKQEVGYSRSYCCSLSVGGSCAQTCATVNCPKDVTLSNSQECTLDSQDIAVVGCTACSRADAGIVGQPPLSAIPVTAE
jgi:hypothetical protein